jgi:hypothetical protein
MAIILKANKVNLFVCSVLFVFWYHSPNFLDTPRIFHEVVVLFNILKKINLTNFTLSYFLFTLRLFNDAFLTQAI